MPKCIVLVTSVVPSLPEAKKDTARDVGGRKIKVKMHRKLNQTAEKQTNHWVKLSTVLHKTDAIEVPNLKNS